MTGPLGVDRQGRLTPAVPGPSSLDPPPSLVLRAPRLPPFAVLRDLRTAALLGTAGGLPLAVVVGLLDVPGWAETLASFLLVLGCFLALALAFRLGLHGVNAFVAAGRPRHPDLRALDVGRLSRRPVAASGALLTAYLWVAAASGLVTGDWTP